ncbi:LysR family transcriptional regulator [Alteromonas sp. C1M14]|uniref:LysR family transcriptional regulator n=1 Tax=Alteromonas sp. C1M14 TaxID=2841567 RepID=UPI001C09128E|nr:LysR family transcriptional regulator [Alteromonas sp. C1M14]MBU2978491.1 LysR family transcriptional regulator [Alteromonas sp. C1M14]
MVKADDILLFVWVVEEGTFSKVAAKYDITLSVVSKRITRLEKALNVQLLYRTTRKLSLTDAGHALYSKAKVAEEALQSARDAVSGYGSDIKGKIKITMPVVTANLVLNRALTDFCQQYPGVEVELSVTNRVVDLLDEGFDLAIRTALLEDSSLIARRLIDSQWVLCASAAYLTEKGVPQHPTELVDHHCLIYKYEGSGPDNWPFLVEGEKVKVQVHGRFHTNTLNSLKEAAISGFGIAYLPKALVFEDLQQGTLVPLLAPFVAKKLGIYAVYPKTRQPDNKLNLLVEYLRTALHNKENYFY